MVERFLESLSAVALKTATVERFDAFEKNASRLFIFILLFCFSVLIVVPSSLRASSSFPIFGLSNFDTFATFLGALGVGSLTLMKTIRLLITGRLRLISQLKTLGQIASFAGVFVVGGLMAVSASLEALIGSIQILILLLFVTAFSNMTWLTRQKYWVFPPILLLTSTFVSFLCTDGSTETVLALTLPFLAIACLRSVQLTCGSALTYLFCSLAVGASFVLIVSGGNRTGIILVGILFLIFPFLRSWKSPMVLLADIASRLVFLGTLYFYLFKRPALIFLPDGEFYDSGRVEIWNALLEDLTWFGIRGFGSARNHILEITAGAEASPHSSIIAIAYDIGLFWTLLLGLVVAFAFATMGFAQFGGPTKGLKFNFLILVSLLMFAPVLAVNYVTEQISLSLAMGLLAIWCAPESETSHVRRRALPGRALFSPEKA